jgi:hypothetical protein
MDTNTRKDQEQANALLETERPALTEVPLIKRTPGKPLRAMQFRGVGAGRPGAIGEDAQEYISRMRREEWSDSPIPAERAAAA